MKRLNVLHIIDVWGWSYNYICQDKQKYSKHNIIIKPVAEVSDHDIASCDLVWISSVDINDKARVEIPRMARRHGKKVIGCYSGEIEKTYPIVDAVATISPPLYKWCLSQYPKNIPVIYVNESIDAEYFTPVEANPNRFQVGYIGRLSPVKRIPLMDSLDYPILKQCDHGKQFFVANATLDKVREFHKQIDVKVLTSSSECKSRVLAEAMASGLPCISTDVGAAKMMLSPEFVVDNGNESQIREDFNTILSQLAEDFELRRDIGTRNREWVEKYFAWKTNMAGYDTVFETVFGGNYSGAKRVSDEWISQFQSTFDQAKPFTKRIDL